MMHVRVAEELIESAKQNALKSQTSSVKRKPRNSINLGSSLKNKLSSSPLLKK